MSGPPISSKYWQDLPRKPFHRAHHARVLHIPEPEAAVEVRDPHHLFDALDLTDHRIRRADDQEAVEQVVGIGLLGAGTGIARPRSTRSYWLRSESVTR